MLTIAAWVLFAPKQLGGDTAFILVSGNSMVPTLQLGDLVVVRQADRYQVGDVVTYQFPGIGPVIHRIVARKEGRYVLQGDHNAWLDSYQPSDDAIIGKLWWHVPGAGKWLSNLRQPQQAIPLVALAGACGVVINKLTSDEAGRRKRQDDRNRRQRPWRRSRSPNKGVSSAMNRASSSGDTITLVLLIVGAVSVGLGVMAFTQPLTRSAMEDLGYSHQGTFAYTAQDTQGIFDNGTIQSGEPIFRKFTDVMTVTFAYLLTWSRASDIAGTHRLVAEVSDATGWKRTLELAPTTSFTGTSFVVARPVDLNVLSDFIRRMEEPTGIHRSQYAVTIMAQVLVLGKTTNHIWQEKFSPRLTLQLDETQLRLADGATLAQSQKGTAKREHTEPNSVKLLLFQIDVLAARVGAAIALAASALGVSGVAVLRRRGDPASTISSRYGELMVTVHRVQELPGSRIDVAAIDDLVRLAEKENSMVLHTADTTGHHYFVQDGPTTYCFSISASESGSGANDHWARGD